MPKRKISPTTTASLSHESLLPLTLDLRRLISRLPKSALIALALRWLSPEHLKWHTPNLTVDGANEDEPDEISLEEAIEIYEDFRRSTPTRAKDVAERMLELEWRDGVTMLGVAELEWEYMKLHPTSQKWSSLFLSPATPLSSSQPRFYLPTFLSALQASLCPTQIAHFFTTTYDELPLTLIRVSLHDPHAALVLPPRRKTFWLAFPQGGEHVFTTLNSGEGVRDLVVAGIAEGVSRSGSRFEVKTGRFQARSLEAMCHFRGAQGGSGGLVAGWGMYVDGFEGNPLAPPREIKDNTVAERQKRQRLLGVRFGKEQMQNNKAVESIFFELREKYPEAGMPIDDDDEDGADEGDGVFRPTVGIKFEGNHVFRGIRKISAIEKSMFDLEMMPGWTVGDEGVTSGIVQEGRVRRKKNGRFYNGT